MDKLSLSKFKSCGALKTTIAAKLIYLLLDELSFFENGEVTISQRVISRVLQLSRSTVSRNLHRLKEVGAISIIPQFYEDGGRTANKYIIW